MYWPFRPIDRLFVEGERIGQRLQVGKAYLDPSCQDRLQLDLAAS